MRLPINNIIKFNVYTGICLQRDCARSVLSNKVLRPCNNLWAMLLYFSSAPSTRDIAARHWSSLSTLPLWAQRASYTMLRKSSIRFAPRESSPPIELGRRRQKCILWCKTALFACKCQSLESVLDCPREKNAVYERGLQIGKKTNKTTNVTAATATVKVVFGRLFEVFWYGVARFVERDLQVVAFESKSEFERVKNAMEYNIFVSDPSRWNVPVTSFAEYFETLVYELFSQSLGLCVRRHIRPRRRREFSAKTIVRVHTISIDR